MTTRRETVPEARVIDVSVIANHGWGIARSLGLSIPNNAMKLFNTRGLSTA